MQVGGGDGLRFASLSLGLALTLAAGACGDDGVDGPEEVGFGDWAPAFDADSVGWMMSAWGPSDDRLFAVGGAPGEAALVELRGGAWAPVNLPPDTPMLNWVYGFGDDQVWAVGDGGTALLWDGASWTSVPTPTDQNLWGVWGAAPDDVWAVGGGTTPPGGDVEPTVLRWNGEAWSTVAVPTLIPSGASQLFKVWGTAADNVYIVGAQGVILRWDGATLAQEVDRPRSHTSDYVSLWGTGPDRIVVVGGRANAQIAAWDGERWSEVQLPRSPGLNGIWMAEPDVFYTVGVRGIAATVRLQPGTEGLESTVERAELVPDLSGIDLHAVFGTPAGRLIAVGGNFAQANGPFRGAAVVAPIRGAR